MIGVVFSRSTTNGDIGYALTSPGVLSRVHQAAGLEPGGGHRPLHLRLTPGMTPRSVGIRPGGALTPASAPTRHGGMALPIEDYGIIGDLHTAALVGRDGSIDWLCLPRFDSAACFAKLLGRRGPRLVEAGSEGVTSAPPHRHYRGDTLVLESEFVTDEGTVRVIDCMPIRQQHPEVVRLVEGVRGKVTMEMVLTIRFGYGQIVPWVRTSTAPSTPSPVPTDCRCGRRCTCHGPGPLHRGRVHGDRGAASSLLADLVPGQRGAAPPGRRRLRHPGHRAVVDGLGVAVHLSRATTAKRWSAR